MITCIGWFNSKPDSDFWCYPANKVRMYSVSIFLASPRTDICNNDIHILNSTIATCYKHMSLSQNKAISIRVNP